MERVEGKTFVQIPSPFSLFYAGLFLMLPFSIFMFPMMDMWNSSGLFFQGGVFILFLLSFVEKYRNTFISDNKPILIFSLWAMVSTAFIFYKSASQNYYNHLNMYTFFNFLTFLVFYKLSVDHLTREKMDVILKYVTYGISCVVAYAILQKFNLDQFQNPLETQGMAQNDARKIASDYIVGTIGNPTHLSAYLGISLPLFYMRDTKFHFFTACLIWLVIGWTGSSSGLLTAISATAFYGIFFKAKAMTPIIVGIVFYAVMFASKGNLAASWISTYLNPYGRFEIWGKILEICKVSPIFGHGLGYMRFLHIVDKTNTNWGHAHSEMLQLLLELGLIGVSLVVLCLFHYFKTFMRSVKGGMNVALASMMVGFIVNSFFSFPAHLWLISSLVMISYTFIYVSQNEEEHSYDTR